MVNLKNFSFHGKELQDIGQIDIGYSIQQQLEQYVSFMTGVTCQTQLGNYYPTGDVGRKMTTCDDAASWDNTPVSITINPVFWYFKGKQCAVNFTTDMENVALRNNMPTTDISQTALARTIGQWIVNDLILAMWRYVFFNDTKESNQGASTGNKHILKGYDSTLVTWCDGIFSANKKLSAADVVIAENKETTTAGQLALTPENAYQYIHDLVIPYSPASVSHIISAQPDAQILCTMTIYNALRTYFHSKTAEQGYLWITQNKEITFNGIRVIGMPTWDYWINRVYWNPDGTTADNSVWYKPHRILFTPKSNIVVAVNNTTVYENLDVDYSATDRTVRWLTDGLFDVQLRQPGFCLTAH